MERIAVGLRKADFILRSGHADGADLAFESGAGRLAEVYLPWPGFNRQHRTNGWATVFVPKGKDRDLATALASIIHPNWSNVGDAARDLHMRNVFQVWGQDLETPSEFLICYAKPHRKSVQGGTRTAYELAQHARIPTFNLYDECEIETLGEFLSDLNIDLGDLAA